MLYKAKLSNVSILSVDPDPRSAELLRGVLRSLGFGRFHHAVSMQDALHILRTQTIDIMITEWDVADASCPEIIRYLRVDPDSPNKRLPVLVLTGKSRAHYVAAARDAGMTEFVVRPFTIRTLCQRISLIIDQPREFVINASFAGPDRRRRSASASNDERRLPVNDGAVIASNHYSRVVRKGGQDIIFIEPDFSLQRKLRGLRAVDMFTTETMRRAEEVVEHGRDQFMRWAAEDLQALEQAYAKLQQEDCNLKEQAHIMHRAAMALKSHSGQFGYGLATSVADSLAAVMDEPIFFNEGISAAIRKHLDILYLVYEKDVQGLKEDEAQALLASLQHVSKRLQGRS